MKSLILKLNTALDELETKAGNSQYEFVNEKGIDSFEKAYELFCLAIKNYYQMKKEQVADTGREESGIDYDLGYLGRLRQSADDRIAPEAAELIYKNLRTYTRSMKEAANKIQNNL
jgi:hypothetical protein